MRNHIFGQTGGLCSSLRPKSISGSVSSEVHEFRKKQKTQDHGDGLGFGVFRELLSAFVRHHNQPTVRQMTVIFEALQKNLRPILQETGAASPFEASVFRRISVYASALADEVVKH